VDFIGEIAKVCHGTGYPTYPRMKQLVVLLVAALCPVLARAGLKVGFAERDITPEIGMEVPGGYGKAFAKRIHDPCKVRAAVFDDGRQRVAIVGLDSLVVPRQLVLEAREQIHARTGIPAEAVLIAASHSHSSGPLGMILPGEFDHASELAKDLAYNKSSCADPKYLAMVREAVIEAVVAADAGRADATAGFGVGKEETVAFNRRIRMKNGLSFSHPGKGNPDNVEFAGPTDPEVGVIGVWNPDGKLLGCIVNFACHATASGPWVSANWIYYMEKAIQGYYGADAKVVFLAGACGDVTQVNNLDPHANPESDAWSQFVGGRVGAEAVKVLLGMSQTRVNEVPVAAQQKTWKIKRRTPDLRRIAEALELAKQDPKTAGPDWVWAKETVLLDALLAKHPEVEVEVQAIQIGPVLCVSNPAEYFCQYGLDLKAGSEFPITFPVELANGCVGYVPTEEALGPQGGGYETRLTSYSNLEITAGRQFRDVGLELAKKLTPAKLPERPLAGPWKQGWSYGNVPPQLE
jgi:neutral ceramidase